MNKTREYIAAEWRDTRDDYVSFCTQYIDTFNLNDVQTIALKHLCDLAEAYAIADKELRDADITCDEAFRISSTTTGGENCDHV